MWYCICWLPWANNSSKWRKGLFWMTNLAIWGRLHWAERRCWSRMDKAWLLLIMFSLFSNATEIFQRQMKGENLCENSWYSFVWCYLVTWNWGLPGGSDGKGFAYSVGDLGLIPQLGRSSGGGHGNPLQHSCLENPHEQRGLADYSPWGRKEWDPTEWLSTHAHWQLSTELILLHYSNYSEGTAVE